LSSFLRVNPQHWPVENDVAHFILKETGQLSSRTRRSLTGVAISLTEYQTAMADKESPPHSDNKSFLKQSHLEWKLRALFRNNDIFRIVRYYENFQ
jgi:hypothetical protein